MKFKVWKADRQKKNMVMAASLADLIQQGQSLMTFNHAR